MRQLTRLRFQVPERYPMKRKFTLSIGKAIFNFSNRVSSLSKKLNIRVLSIGSGRRFYYLYKRRSFLRKINFLSKSNNLLNIYNKF